MAIPVSVNSKQLGFRLMELPTELIELLESTEAPVLQLKSSDSSVPSQAPANAVLCTPSQSYEVRQVQSSNVLYILQQSLDSGFTAIAQCKGMLELVPSKGNATEYVRRVVPTYGMGILAQKKITRAELNVDAPYSEKELLDALVGLCAFEKDDSLWIPDSRALLKVWRSLFIAATINGVKLDQPWRADQLTTQVVEDDIDVEMYGAVIARLSSELQDLSEVTFDMTATTTWIGQTILNSLEESMPKDKFIAQWADLLPESWRSMMKLDLLQDKYSLSEDNFITGINRPINAPDEKKAALPPKSKWHQKFGR